MLTAPHDIYNTQETHNTRTQYIQQLHNKHTIYAQYTEHMNTYTILVDIPGDVDGGGEGDY